MLDRIRFTVIGVMPPHFFGPEVGTHPDVWIPVYFASKVEDSGCIGSRNCFWLMVMARVRPGVTAAQANADLQAVSPAVLRATTPPGWNSAWKERYLSYTFGSEPGEHGWSFLRLQFTDPLLMLMALVALVLLIACANMAGLLLARASARRREIAVRLSMGAGRIRVVRQLLTESLLLSIAGGLAGMLFAFWLDVMGTRLISGRQFNKGDAATAETVGIPSELAAQRFFPGRDPIGEHVLLAGKPIRIIGIAEDMKSWNLREKNAPELYVPYTQRNGELPPFTFVLKMYPGAGSPSPAFRAMLHDLAPDVPLGMTYTMEQEVESSVGLERLMASLSAFFGILALLVTSIGLYGILAYTATRRTGEIGIRMALGARRGHVIWLVLRETIGSVLLGIVFGVAAAIAGSRLIVSLLYGIRPNDPGNLIAAVLALLSVAALSAFLPLLRASRVDPAVSLRQE